MRAGGLEETVLTTATKTDVRARRVLLIEDDTASAQALSEVLELEGYEVRAVRNGADAVSSSIRSTRRARTPVFVAVESTVTSPPRPHGRAASDAPTARLVG